MSTPERQYYPDEEPPNYAPEYSGGADYAWLERLSGKSPHKRKCSSPMTQRDIRPLPQRQPQLSLVPRCHSTAIVLQRDPVAAERALYRIRHGALTLPDACSVLLDHGSDEQIMSAEPDLHNMEIACRRARRVKLRAAWKANQAPRLFDD